MEEIRFETDCGQEEVHLHEELEVLFALTGRVNVSVGERHFVLEPEGVLVFNPFESHQLSREWGGHTLSLYIPMGLLAQTGMRRIGCCSALQPEKAVYLEDLRDKLAALFLEHQNPQSNELHRLSRVFALLGVLRQGFEEGGGPRAISESDAQWLGQVFAYIQENLGEKLSLQDTARAFYVSSSHLSRKFQRLTGQVYSDFVRDMRLKTAETLLLGSHSSVTEIAAQCGFANPNSFIQSFQQRFDCTPGRFRRMNQGRRSAGSAISDVSYMSLTRHTSHDDRSLSFSQPFEGRQAIRVDMKEKGKVLRL